MHAGAAARYCPMPDFSKQTPSGLKESPIRSKGDGYSIPPVQEQ